MDEWRFLLKCYYIMKRFLISLCILLNYRWKKKGLGSVIYNV